MKYAVNNQNYIIAELPDIHNYPGTVYETDPPLVGGTNFTIEYGGFRCYKFKIVSGIHVEQIIKRYGVKDSYDDIIYALYTNDPSTDYYEISDSLVIKDSIYDVPLNKESGGSVIAKPDIKDRPELVTKVTKIDNTTIEEAIAVVYTLGKEFDVVKDYLDWVVAGKPASDARETAYIAMQAAITVIKNA